MLSIDRSARLIALTVWVATGAMAQAAEPPGKTPDACFWARNVSGFAPVKGARDRVRITVGLRDIYELSVRGCENAELAFSRIALQSIGLGGRICRPEEAELIVPETGGPPQRCIVTAIRPIPPAELAAEKAGR